MGLVALDDDAASETHLMPRQSNGIVGLIPSFRFIRVAVGTLIFVDGAEIVERTLIGVVFRRLLENADDLFQGSRLRGRAPDRPCGRNPRRPYATRPDIVQLVRFALDVYRRQSLTPPTTM